jgi:eukaryotic-like serine/threonine-protein kinase
MSQHAWRLRATNLAAVAILAVIALSACASEPASSKPSVSPSAHTATPAAPVRAVTTATHVFAAFDSGGAPVAGVAAHRSGTCWTSSITVSARSGYRCFAGNQILDPCFASSAARSTRTVDCYADPWGQAVRLTLKKALPAPGAPLKISQPWAIELAGGDRCVVTTGTAPLVGGVTMRYQCDTGTAGLLSDRGSLLKVQYRAPGGALQRIAVAGSWTA